MDSLLSLRCPLSIDRMEIPAKGEQCSHRRCFDLETYLQFSAQSGNWQCPICYNPLPFEASCSAWSCLACCVLRRSLALLRFVISTTLLAHPELIFALVSKHTDRS